MQRLSSILSRTSWGDNLIVRREWARREGFAAFGLRCVVMLAIPLAWGLAGHNDLGELIWILISGLPFLALGYFGRAALATLGAIRIERQQSTWEPLIESGMPLADFRKGWLLVGSVRLWSESALSVLVIVGLLTAAGLGSFDCLLALGLLAATLGITVWIGAKVGLTLSAMSGNGLSLAKLTVLAFLAGVLLWSVELRCFERELRALPNFCQVYASRIAWVGFPILTLLVVGSSLEAWSDQRWSMTVGPATRFSGWLWTPIVSAVLAASLVLPRLWIPLRFDSEPGRLIPNLLVVLVVPFLVAHFSRAKVGWNWVLGRSAISAALVAAVVLFYDCFVALHPLLIHPGRINFFGGVGLSTGLGLLWGALDLTLIRRRL